MTQVTVLERTVIRNVALIQLAGNVLASQISEGPEAIKANQVGAVLMNLKRKGLVTQENSSVVSLTDAGVAVHSREFPSVAKTLDELRHASNLELNAFRPMSVEELTLTNQLIAIRKSAMKLAQHMEAFKQSLVADSSTVDVDQVIAA